MNRSSSCWAATGNGPRRRNESSIPCSEASVIERDEPVPQAREDLSHLDRLHPRLEVVEQSVVGLVDLEAGRVLAAKLDIALEVGTEELEVVRPPRLDPDREGLRRRPGLRLAELDRDVDLLLAVAARNPDQAGLVGVVVEALLVGPELFEQLAELLRDDLLVDDLRDGRELARPDRRALRGHHRLLVPARERAELGEIPQLGQPVAQLLVPRLAHRETLAVSSRPSGP